MEEERLRRWSSILRLLLLPLREWERRSSPATSLPPWEESSSALRSRREMWLRAKALDWERPVGEGCRRAAALPLAVAVALTSLTRRGMGMIGSSGAAMLQTAHVEAKIPRHGYDLKGYADDPIPTVGGLSRASMLSVSFAWQHGGAFGRSVSWRAEVGQVMDRTG